MRRRYGICSELVQLRLEIDLKLHNLLSWLNATTILVGTTVAENSSEIQLYSFFVPIGKKLMDLFGTAYTCLWWGSFCRAKKRNEFLPNSPHIRQWSHVRCFLEHVCLSKVVLILLFYCVLALFCFREWYGVPLVTYSWLESCVNVRINPGTTYVWKLLLSCWDRCCSFSDV